MQVDRRILWRDRAFSVFAGACATGPTGLTAMHGLTGKFTAADGRRDELVGYLLKGLRDMPGCLSYIVASDPAIANAIWVTDASTDPERQKASLGLPLRHEAIRKARPIITGRDSLAETQQVGGHGRSSAG